MLDLAAIPRHSSTGACMFQVAGTQAKGPLHAHPALHVHLPRLKPAKDNERVAGGPASNRRLLENAISTGNAMVD